MKLKESYWMFLSLIFWGNNVSTGLYDINPATSFSNAGIFPLLQA